VPYFLLKEWYEQLSFILSYDNAQALLYSSFVHDEDMRASLCGETGEIYMDSKWHATSMLTW
jgi:hypothetical protein